MDFVQTMKDWHRMCVAMGKERPDDVCCGCRLEGYGCPAIPAIYEDNSHVDFRDVEKQVSAWAAEHPEPVYPTWWEWLASIGAVTRKVKPDVASELIETGLLDTIPAELAEKLGIQPKEVKA